MTPKFGKVTSIGPNIPARSWYGVATEDAVPQQNAIAMRTG